MQNTLLSQLPSTRTPLRVSRADLKLAWGFVICRARKSFSNFKYVLVKLAEIYSSSANFLPLLDPHMQVRLVLLLFYNTSYSRNIINIKKILDYIESRYFTKQPTLKNQAEDEFKQKTGSYYSSNLDTIPCTNFLLYYLNFCHQKTKCINPNTTD